MNRKGIVLAGGSGNLCVVGDDAQSIYAWRGANFKNILEFPQRYFGCQTFKIEVNYRSTPEILAFANAAIAPNIHQFQKALAPARPSGMKPVVVACMDAGEQASFVAQRALELRDEGIPLNEMAVLYRSHFHALELQFELLLPKRLLIDQAVGELAARLLLARIDWLAADCAE